MDISSIGKNIKKRRIEKSWSQEMLAEKTNLSTAYIGMIERGEKVPKLETFLQIINCLEVSADVILMDVLVKGYKIRTSKFEEEIARLSDEEKKRIYNIIEAFLG